MKHDFYEHCENDDCGGVCPYCPYCTLAVCKICGLYEGSLTTDCPGVDSYTVYSDRIYNCEIDFIDGKWVEK